jgi:hypothetical protein
MLTDHFSYYHGEAINPRHLSLFERCVDRDQLPAPLHACGPFLAPQLPNTKTNTSISISSNTTENATLSRYVLKWSRNYNPALDAAHKEIQSLAPSLAPSSWGRAHGDVTTGTAYSISPYPSGGFAWSDSGWTDAAGGGGGSTGGLESLGRGVAGPSWAASVRSNAASRRLPTTGEEQGGEGEAEAEGSSGGGGGRGGRGAAGAHPSLEDVD